VQALALLDDRTWPPLPQGACIPCSLPKHLPEAFCFTNRRPLAQPWASFDLEESDENFFSTVSVKNDSLVITIPVSPGVFERWIAPGALVAGCGAVAWWLARTAITSAQPVLLAAAIPFGTVGAVLGGMAHHEGRQVRALCALMHAPNFCFVVAARSKHSAIERSFFPRCRTCSPGWGLCHW
jgi:hypothetical protein